MDYRDFLQKLTFEVEKYKIIDYLFLTIQATMSKLGVSQLYDFFAKFDNTSGMR